MTKDYSELNRVSAEIGYTLYPKEEWDAVIKEHDEKGISFEHNVMVSEALATTFEKHPHLFDGLNSITSDDGYPLWVREGYDWQPDIYDDDDYEEDEED